jgi:hypothetical protein
MVCFFGQDFRVLQDWQDWVLIMIILKNSVHLVQNNGLIFYRGSAEGRKR